MAFLTAENISLRFPIFRGIAGNADTKGNADDPRIRRDSHGRIKELQALTNVSFSASKGDRIAIIGRNGSGKSTLLSVLAGLVPPNEGIVRLSSRPTNLININLGMEQEADGHRNIILRGLAAGLTKAQIELRRKSIEEFSGLGQFLDLPVNTLSAGMRMRLNFAIATAFDADILILDEWLSAGDIEFQQKAAKRMQDVVSSAGIVVMASHGRRMIQDVCNKCLWLDAGRVRTFGDTESVLGQYEAEVGLRR